MRIARLAVRLGDEWVTLIKTTNVEYIYKMTDTPYVFAGIVIWGRFPYSSVPIRTRLQTR